MALNYSHRPIDNPEDILPDDPFGMDMTVTAITEWLHDLRVSDYLRCGMDEVGVSSKGQQPFYSGYGGLNLSGVKGHFSAFCGYNLLWYNAMSFQPYTWENGLYSCINYAGCSNRRYSGFQSYMGNVLDRSDIYGSCSTQNMDENRSINTMLNNDNASGSYNDMGYECIGDGFGEFVTKEGLENFFDERGVYHWGKCTFVDSGDLKGGVVDRTEEIRDLGLSFALAHLGIRDLLTVERVCKSLRYAVQNDPLLWRSIHIDHPLNTMITNDALIQLTDRAQGHLQCLTLDACKPLTNEVLSRVLESNPKLLKLSVLGCTSINIETIISCLKSFQRNSIPGIKILRVDGRTVTLNQLEELNKLLGIPNHVQSHHREPHFLRSSNLSSEDIRPLDLDICPKCHKVTLVYDCTTKSCKAKEQSSDFCRACVRCINRCRQCGRCIEDVVHEEDFVMENVCSDCMPIQSNCVGIHDYGNIEHVNEQGG